jgi:hypothetical protein
MSMLEKLIDGGFKILAIANDCTFEWPYDSHPINTITVEWPVTSSGITAIPNGITEKRKHRPGQQTHG